MKKVLSRFTSVSDVFLALRVLGWALVLPILKHVVPVRRLAAVMHLAPRSDPCNFPREDRIVTFARWGARLIRWKSGGNCLERGLIAYRYLCQAGAKPTCTSSSRAWKRATSAHAERAFLASTRRRAGLW